MGPGSPQRPPGEGPTPTRVLLRGPQVGHFSWCKAQEQGGQSPLQLGWGVGGLEAALQTWRLPRSGAKLTWLTLNRPRATTGLQLILGSALSPSPAMAAVGRGGGAGSPKGNLHTEFIRPLSSFKHMLL